MIDRTAQYLMRTVIEGVVVWFKHTLCCEVS